MRWPIRAQLKRSERFLKKVLSTTLLRSFRHSCHHWRIGIRTSKHGLLNEGPNALSRFRWIDSPRGHFYADPMLLQHQGRTWLFVEDYLYATDEARSILVAEVSQNGEVGPFMPSLTADYHLSYPLVFSHAGEIFMVPETAAHRTVELYRAVRFPLEWRLETVLYPHPAYDTTPLYHDGLWWFFTSISVKGGRERVVPHLFYADSLTGEWQLHPSTSIGGCDEARGAGPIFKVDDRLIRPTQCGRPVYGYSFAFEEITRLDRAGFSEQRLACFEPTWQRHLLGMHTYGRAGDVEVIDGCWGVNPYDVM
jgi:hypothetical protein